MALTATVRATKPVVGADTGLWGGEINSDLDYFDAAINGFVAVPVPDANVVLTADGTAADQARFAIYNFTGVLTANRTITLPPNQKLGFAINSTTGGHSVILANATGVTVAIPPVTGWLLFWSNGAGVSGVPLSLASQTVGSLSTLNISSGQMVAESQSSGPVVAVMNSRAGPGTCIMVRNDRTDIVPILFQSGGVSVGNITNDGSAVHYNTTSDETLKDIKGPLTAADAGRIIDGLQPIWFSWKSDGKRDPEPGFGAQTTFSVFPWAVTPGDDDERPWTMDPAKLMVAAIAEIKALRERVADLEHGIVRP